MCWWIVINYILEFAEQYSELETVHKLYDDKVSRIQELKEKKEAMEVELQKIKNENPHNKIKDFEDLAGKYTTHGDQLVATLAQKSHH